MSIIEKLLSSHLEPLYEEIRILKEKNARNEIALSKYENLSDRVDGLAKSISDYSNIRKNISNLNEMLSNYSDICKNIGNLNQMLSNYPDICKNIGNLNQMLSNYSDVCKNLGNLNHMLSNYHDICVNVSNSNNILKKATEDYGRICFELSKLKKEAHVLRSSQENKGISEVLENENISVSDPYIGIDYFDFENHFRGSRSLIKERQAQYLKYFKDKNYVIDIGCGRGEFLEILKEEGIKAVGVDIYSDYVDYCNQLGLIAFNSDGIDYLKKTDKVDGIFACQVIEHLNVNQIIDLLETAYEKLEENGVIVLETPNPQSLSIFSNAFYVDPSHTKPVHPETVKYLLAKAGFKEQKIEIIYTECSKPSIVYPVIDGEDEFNSSYHMLLDLVYGSKDYAIVATKT